MNTYEFTVIVDGLNIRDNAHTDRIYSPDIDLLIAERDGITSIAVVIDANTDDEALREVRKFLHWRDVRVVRVDEEFVNTTEISERLEVSRETVRLWAKDRSTIFPLPYTVISGQKVWKWADIYAWAIARGEDVSYFDMPLGVGLVAWFNATRLQGAYRDFDFHAIGKFAVESSADDEAETLQRITVGGSV